MVPGTVSLLYYSFLLSLSPFVRKGKQFDRIFGLLLTFHENARLEIPKAQVFSKLVSILCNL